MVRSTIALAMAMGLNLTAAAVAAPADLAPALGNEAAAPIVPPARPSAVSAVAPELPETAGDAIPAARVSPPRSDHPADAAPLPTVRPAPSVVTTTRPHNLDDTPMAPLPPAVVAGPIGLLLAGWMARRANRRGGRV